jgi:hypothetical protein
MPVHVCGGYAGAVERFDTEQREFSVAFCVEEVLAKTPLVAGIHNGSLVLVGSKVLRWTEESGLQVLAAGLEDTASPCPAVILDDVLFFLTLQGKSRGISLSSFELTYCDT